MATRNTNNSNPETSEADGVVFEEGDSSLEEGISGATSASNVPSTSGFRELSSTPKPVAKRTKNKDQSEFQSRVLQLVDQEEDELGMTLTAVGKKIKQSLNQEDQDELMDEVQMLVSKFIKNKKTKTMPIAVNVTTSATPGTNLVNPINVTAPSASGFEQIPPMPMLQRRNML